MKLCTVNWAYFVSGSDAVLAKSENDASCIIKDRIKKYTKSDEYHIEVINLSENIQNITERISPDLYLPSMWSRKAMVFQ